MPRGFGRTSGLGLGGRGMPGDQPDETPGIPTRVLQSNDSSAEGVGDVVGCAGRYVLSTTVIPLELPLRGTKLAERLGTESSKPTAGSSSKSTTDIHNNLTPLAASKPGEHIDGAFEKFHPRHLFTSREGTSPWLLHERLGREPQRAAERERRCGSRAYLLVEWDATRSTVSEPVST